MNLKKGTCLIILLINFLTLSVFAQVDSDQEKCKNILQKISNSIENNTSTKFNFKLEIISEDFNESQNGYALIQEGKFYYKTNEREVISDGVNVWTYIIEDNECYIDLLDDLDNTINPSEVFSIWKNGFKFKYISNMKLNNDLLHKIKLFPSNPSESNYHTVIMEVNETKKTIKEVSIKTKDGVTIKININSLAANSKILPNQFLWQKSKYVDVDEIDNR